MKWCVRIFQLLGVEEDQRVSLASLPCLILHLKGAFPLLHSHLFNWENSIIVHITLNEIIIFNNFESYFLNDFMYNQNFSVY